MTSVVLLCAVLSALAGGVLFAYGLCYSMFHLFRIHSIQAAQTRVARQHEASLAAARTTLDTLA